MNRRKMYPRWAPIRQSLTAQIYFTSRTHTQLRQLTSELLKTTFVNSSTESSRSSPESGDGVSMVPLASRKQLCINEKVRALGKMGGDERMNEACLDMQKAGEYLKTLDHCR
jgi:chromosome transmission fidelity protein 1